MSLFQSSVLQKHLSAQDQDSIASAYEKYTAYFLNPQIQENIRGSKEEQFQEGFLRELFVNILGYTINPNPNFNLTTELKNIKDAKKTDGAVLKDGKALAVIELKGADTKDLDKVTDQAFNYKNNQPQCVYVVTSNYEKLRFYIHNAVQHEEFHLFTLTFDQFKLLWLFLQKDNLLRGVPEKLKEESLLEEERVTKQLYKDYSAFKSDLWQDMCRNNSEADELELYKKSQKLLDRFLFILFAEDKGLLPPNSISLIVKQWKKLKELDEYKPLYSRFQKYFGYMNDGFKGKNFEIHAYNGGLFKVDPLLDDLTISDDVLEKHVLKLTEYDFETEVDTNILGHIFEHSLNDIENVRAQLVGEDLDKSTTKRKKDGVFYTPKYITKYIVDNTVGTLCAEKKAEIGINEEEFAKDRRGRRTETLKRLDEQLKEYREWLLQLTICDPACGSGAFLNQALEFLMAEHHYIDELESQLLGYAMVFPDVENHILERNIYGVDINEESVEIARLSLWLRTAKKGRKLTSLGSNIKVGNSLIDDPKVGGELAFNWEGEFPVVFEKGGFDVVIGNPPYVDIKALDSILVRALFENYSCCENRINLYSVFIEKGYSLTRAGGALSYINPNSILINSSYTKIRKKLIDDVFSIIKLPDDVFSDAKVETIIFELRKNLPSDTLKAVVFGKSELISFIDVSRARVISKQHWKQNEDFNYNIFITDEQFHLLSRLGKMGKPLGDVADFMLGITPYDKYQGHSEETIKTRAFHSKERSEDAHKPLISGSNIRRYAVRNEVDEYIRYGDWLGAMREERFFIEPRILVRQIVSGKPPRIYAGYTDKPLYFTQIGFGIIPSEELNIFVLLATINSNLINFYHKFRFLDLEKELFQKILIANCKKFPVVFGVHEDLEGSITKHVKTLTDLIGDYLSDESSFIELIQSKFPIDKPSKQLQNWPQLDFKGFLAELKKAKVHLSLEQEAEWLIYFNKQKTEANTLQAEIDRIDKHIDQMVYKLYGLSEDEIRIVEQAS